MNWNDLKWKLWDACDAVLTITLSLLAVIWLVLIIVILICAIRGDDISKHRTRTGNSVSAPLLIPMPMPR